MSWLVTGGAGYIGAHVVRALLDAGIPVVVLDDLSTGFERFVPEQATFVRGTLLDADLVESTVAGHDLRGVIHVAGYKYAGESVKLPLHTYEQNVTAMVILLRAMERAGVDKLVFSSSAATFGAVDVEIVDESTPVAPQSPYGETKLIGEWLLADQARATGLAHTSLRYFNVVGSGSDDLFDASPHNLFPLVFDMLVRGATPRINGDDYPTPDGTCVRDYIHVADLALAHVAAAQRLEAGRPVEPVYNLGSGAGTSVREIMTAIREVTGIDFEPEITPRRPGDPARIVAAGDLAARDLGWTMRHSLQDMVASAWQARRKAGDAYPR
ncbi:UDP-glucose 4-epimerase GalE [Mycolicibacterium tokaiense]|uniref:UDP-glucose 4-epimerase n=1 Tax=Mycolicibacterium tokaiense TaxID=39695 RepID=A0A378TH42_9MYCO|nr:UDP-glucose 4-epimerase GalE [Mycolicibacterium tokaiense]BBY86337.1 UDP-glucose 4-epimerase GalE [Mycolicibacterium tokaiense]STZ59155.1 UDP-glucose 4-epimerase [Mycolicibacterium tokaiense]